MRITATSFVGSGGTTALAVALLPAAQVLLPAALAAQTVVTKLQPAGGSVDDYFGSVVAFDRGTLAAAEQRADASGAVHLFDHAATAPAALGWAERALLVPADAAPGQRFGAALAAWGDTLLVGAPGDGELGDEAGAAYAWARDRHGTPSDPTDDSWVLLGKLHPQGGDPPARFGAALALAGDTAVIGADTSVHPAAFVFVRDHHGTADPLDDTFVQQAKLQQAPQVALSTFGIAVALLADEKTLVVADSRGSPAAPTGGLSVFARSDNGTPADPLDDLWVLTHLVQPDPDVGGLFGTRLALAPDGRRLLVTAAQAGISVDGRVVVVDHAVNDPGNVLDDTWTESAVIDTPAPGYYSGFGDALVLRGGRALISSRIFGFGPPGTGSSAFLYELQGADWVLQANLRAPDEAVGDGYGISIAFLDDDTALIGAAGGPYVDDDPAVPGAVYALELLLANPWALAGGPVIPGLAGWGGLQPQLPVTVRLYNSFDAGVPALLVLGFTHLDAPFKGSTLVPLPQLVLPLVLGPDGDIALTAPWPAAGAVPPGTTLIFQGWIPPVQPGFPWSATPGIVATQP